METVLSVCSKNPILKKKKNLIFYGEKVNRKKTKRSTILSFFISYLFFFFDFPCEAYKADWLDTMSFGFHNKTVSRKASVIRADKRNGRVNRDEILKLDEDSITEAHLAMLRQFEEETMAKSVSFLNADAMRWLDFFFPL